MACGYQGWSANGGAGPLAMGRWAARMGDLACRGSTRTWTCCAGGAGRGSGARERFAKALARELARRRRAGLWDAPIGFLTHHLAHDARAWGFLERFLAWTAGRAEFAWTALPDLIGEARRHGGAEPLQGGWAVELSLVG